MYDSHYHCRFDREHFVVSPASCLAVSVSHYKGVGNKFWQNDLSVCKVEVLLLRATTESFDKFILQCVRFEVLSILCMLKCVLWKFTGWKFSKRYSVCHIKMWYTFECPSYTILKGLRALVRFKRTFWLGFKRKTERIYFILYSTVLVKYTNVI